MKKNILITGTTSGIGLATVKMLLPLGHNIIIHGTTEEKVNRTLDYLHTLNTVSALDGVWADFSDMEEVKVMADKLLSRYDHLDVIINNAGVFAIPDVITKDKLDVRFAVNTIAPYYLTKLLMPLLNNESRVVNLSSAAQAPVSLNALSMYTGLNHNEAYAQSKLALTMWSFELGRKNDGPSVVAINPKSFLGSKMVKQAYGMEGYDINIGADILVRASLTDEFSDASGKYFDNDRGIFASPHPDALNPMLRRQLIDTIEDVLCKIKK